VTYHPYYVGAVPSSKRCRDAMISIHPIPRALVPRDSEAAGEVGAPNYDEFQSDREIWELLQIRPRCVLAVTMAHCAVPSPEDIGEGDSPAALARAAANMKVLIGSALTRETARCLFAYEIEDPLRPDVRQIGIGGLARTDQIRTDRNPAAPIIRNEGVREAKARGRARLIEATGAIIGTVNNAVPDRAGALAGALERYADSMEPAFEASDAAGNGHRIWLVGEPGAVARFQHLLSREPEAYVADGNHRSAAAAMLGYEHFLAVFFPADRMGIAPYNRLVSYGEPRTPDGIAGLVSGANGAFEPLGAPDHVPYQPERTHSVGLYAREIGWIAIAPRAGSFDPGDAAASIDHDIVQRALFGEALGIEDPADDRLTFVGANKDAAWLQREVDRGHADLAVTLPAVTMEQFIAVCRQGRMMPPKSTWFQPKIRSGLVMALL